MNPKIILSYMGLGGPEIIIIFLVVLCIALIPQIFYLLTLQRTMELVSPDLRRMSPGQVWMVFIPIFGIIWNFLMVGYIADSLAAELQRRNLPYNEERPGHQTGMAMCVCSVCGIIPVIGGLAGLAALVLWIVYWVKIAGYKKQLESSNFFQPPPQMPPYQGQNQGYQNYQG
jgi:hypothetical protein